jgi:DNA primase
MSGRIPRQFIDDLLLRVDIVDLIDSHVPLKKSGSNFVARCPFHIEKTPSFSVSRSRQIYHCFGCGVSGNAISFLMDFNHLDFVEAVEDLAAYIGVDIPRETRTEENESPRRDVSSLYDVLDKIRVFYMECLSKPEGKKALEYLLNRGVSLEIAKSFALGYSPNSWDAFPRSFDQKALIESGMLIRNEEGKVYPRFRGRLMFPIRDKRNRVVGFGGRVLDDTLPKYLNSPETPIFYKSKELYGLSELLEKNSKPAYILVVEGYMDVIALAQFGITNVVAALGTATSKAHMELLFRFTSELVFCFDGDSAGQQAAWKAIEAVLHCLRDGRQIKIMLLPQSCDPDNLVRMEGVAAFEARIMQATVFSEFFFQRLANTLNLNSVEGRSQLLSEAKPLLEKIPAGFFRDMMFSKMQELTGRRVVDIVEKQAKIDSNPAYRPKLRPNLMRTLLSLLLQHPYLAVQFQRHEVDVKGLNFPGAELLDDILQTISDKKPENSAVLLEYYRESPQIKTVKALTNLTFPGQDEETLFLDALHQLLRQVKQNRMSILIEKVNKGEPLSPAEAQEFKAGGKL